MSLRASSQTGVAISWLVEFLVDEFRKTAQKNGLYDDMPLGIRWRFPHQCAHWFGITVLFDALASLDKFQFIALLRKGEILLLYFSRMRNTTG